MSDAACAGCRDLLNGEGGSQQATIVERDRPRCQCEAYSVGLGSPGRVLPGETLYRLIVSPASVDWSKRQLISESTISQASESGLSVFRHNASDEDVTNLIMDRLSRRPDQPVREIRALARFEVTAVQAIQDVGIEGRDFCIYDETVARVLIPTASPVPTHATILQRLVPPGTDGRKLKRKEGEKSLYEVLQKGLVAVTEFRHPLIADLNRRAADGEFIRPR